MFLRAKVLGLCLMALFLSLALAGTYALACPSEPPPPTTLTLGQENPATPPISASQCHAADPVNCASGNEAEEQTDRVVGGRGPSLHLTRTYNSQAAASAKEPGP